MNDRFRPSRGLVRKYSGSGPRYTSYPTAVDFGDDFDAQDYVRCLESASESDESWSLYLHVPFCQRRCHFCACAVIPTQAYDKVADPYVDSLEREVGLVSKHLGTRRGVSQLHLGGGTPTYLDPNALARVFSLLEPHFTLDPEAEISIELDPRVTSAEHLDVLVAKGVNRVSLGVQDFDSVVQDQIGRHQSMAMTRNLVEAARARGIASINVDLVYGLPGQTLEGLHRSIALVEGLGIDRVALYGYAHVPWMRPNQRLIDASLLPGPDTRLQMLLGAREAFEDAGYVAIGMDHFARPDDSLTLAREEGRLRRNFMGYTVAAGQDILGFGVTAIGDVGGAFVQNVTKLAHYQDALGRGELPVARGILRSDDDELRRFVIGELMCNHRISRAAVRQRFGVDDFDRAFEPDLALLKPLLDDELVHDDGEHIEVTPLGELFVRNVAMCFDARLRKRSTGRFSATV